jgi:hypothetical protein
VICEAAKRADRKHEEADKTTNIKGLKLLNEMMKKTNKNEQYRNLQKANKANQWTKEGLSKTEQDEHGYAAAA